MRLACPAVRFAQVGESESSKSAIQPSAPEFRAPMVIFWSVGPVISTQRLRRSGGAEATDHSPSRTSRVSGRKSSVPPWSSSA